MNAKDAFLQLSHTRGWYHELGIKASAAKSMMKRVRDGESISIGKVEEVLLKAGWIVETEKQWAPPGAPIMALQVPESSLKGRPAGWFSGFLEWRYTHEHMLPQTGPWEDLYQMYDEFLRRLKYQNYQKDIQQETYSFKNIIESDEQPNTTAQ